MKKTVLILSTTDTKADETRYLREKLNHLEVEPLLMDLAMRGSGDSSADITPDLVATAGGGSIDEIQASRDRSRITDITIKGASHLAQKLYAEGGVHGILGIGGATGTLMSTEVMRSLPFGLPKLMVSSSAALPGLSTRYIGTGDIALFHSVIEISGLTTLLKNVLDRAAYAMAGMVQDAVTPPKTDKRRAIAMTMNGVCDKCATLVRKSLEEEGYQVIGFHAAGISDRAMEEMVSLGFFRGLIDLSTGGVGEHLFGFMRDAGPIRLESAGKAGIPQVISTSGVNHITPSRSRYKPEYHERRKYDLDKLRTWLRISPDELKEVAHVFAVKLNNSKGPVKIVIPLRGWSSADYPGNATYDPEEDRVFIRELRGRLRPDIEILEVDANMEDPEFAGAIVKTAMDIL